MLDPPGQGIKRSLGPRQLRPGGGETFALSRRFIVAAVLCFLFLTSGLEIVLAFFRGWAPAFLVDVIASMSFLTHFANIAKGVIDLKDLIYFASVIGIALFVNVAIVEFRKGA